MANSNRSANPTNWRKLEPVSQHVFAKYSEYVQFVEDMKSQGFIVRTTRPRPYNRRKVFVYRRTT